MHLHHTPALTFLTAFAAQLQQLLKPWYVTAFEGVADLRTRLDDRSMYVEVRLNAKEGTDFRFANIELQGSDLTINLVHDHLTHPVAKVFSLKLRIATGSALEDTAWQCAWLACCWLTEGAIPDAEELKANIAQLEPVSE